jgi:hypothetical protein
MSSSPFPKHFCREFARREYDPGHQDKIPPQDPEIVAVVFD